MPNGRLSRPRCGLWSGGGGLRAHMRTNQPGTSGSYGSGTRRGTLGPAYPHSPIAKRVSGCVQARRSPCRQVGRGAVRNRGDLASISTRGGPGSGRSSLGARASSPDRRRIWIVSARGVQRDRSCADDRFDPSPDLQKYQGSRWPKHSRNTAARPHLPRRSHEPISQWRPLDSTKRRA